MALHNIKAPGRTGSDAGAVIRGVFCAADGTVGNECSQRMVNTSNRKNRGHPMTGSR
ncbi:hypothetical protein [Leisingera sp. M658]|uniref:hypothetical protein n=1 Tax=Leisingera sp. M658 TaxID=2867015 RepID=UPI0021A71237|nr:hypothetical protein [Leisingera sp. M658]UWQ76500.1 hypothetical protein K3724_08750 [Leisingera sp. M658]